MKDCKTLIRYESNLNLKPFYERLEKLSKEWIDKIKFEISCISSKIGEECQIYGLDIKIANIDFEDFKILIKEILWI